MPAGFEALIQIFFYKKYKEGRKVNLHFKLSEITCEHVKPAHCATYYQQADLKRAIRFSACNGKECSLSPCIPFVFEKSLRKSYLRGKLY